MLDNVKNKIGKWTNRWLSYGGRITLVKSVLQAIPIYVSSVLNIPKAVLRELDHISHRFLWNGTKENRKWALVKWDTLCLPKNEGGLGFRSSINNNKALAAKLYWRMLHNPNALWANNLRAKYAENKSPEDLVRYHLPTKGSSILAVLKTGEDLIKKKLFWIIHNGQQANFWTDSWDGHKPLITQFPDWRPWIEELHRAKWIKVANYCRYNTGNSKVGRYWIPIEDWPIQIPERQRQDIQGILNMRSLSWSHEKDCFGWNNTTKGEYSVAQGYLTLCHNNPNQYFDIFSQLWAHKLWPKVRFFIWLLLHRRVLTGDQLMKRGFHGPFRCEMCEENVETLNHIFIECTLISELWRRMATLLGLQWSNFLTLDQLWRDWPNQEGVDHFIRQLVWMGSTILLWNIWNERNSRIFNQDRKDIHYIWQKTLANLVESVHHLLNHPQNVHQRWDQVLQRLKINSAKENNLKGNVSICKMDRTRNWHPPPKDFGKVNTDGASRGNPGKASVGGIGRLSDGSPVFTFAENLGILSNNLAEGYGILRGLQEATKVGWEKVLVESDSQLMINLLKNPSKNHKVDWRIKRIIDKIHLIQMGFLKVEYNHVVRDQNKSADALANWALDKGDLTCYGHPPIWWASQIREALLSIISLDGSSFEGN